MKKYIRPGGVIAFLVIVGLIAAFWLLFIDGYTERTIEKIGTRIVGARVELSEADVSLFPTGMTLLGLKVTDADEPMTNALEVERIAFTVDGTQLLWRRFVVEEMTATGIRTGTARKTSGAIAKKKKEKKEGGPGLKDKIKDKFELPSFEIPDAEEVLKQADLESLKRVESLKADIEKKRESWQERIENLPDKEKLAEYEKRLEKLKEARSGGVGGALSAAREIESLRKEIKQTTESLKTAEQDFKQDFEGLKAELDEIRKAPAADARRLANKYSLTPEGLTNITGFLFGPRISGYLSSARGWYGRLSPYMASYRDRTKEPEKKKPPRMEGVDVLFREYNPMPGFLVRKLGASASLKQGEFSGRILNITTAQNILGEPTRFSFSGNALENLEALKLNGTFDRVVPENPHDKINLIVSGFSLSDISLSESGNFPVTLREGSLDITSHLEIMKEGRLEGSINGLLDKLSFSAGPEGEGGSLIVQGLSEAISEVKRLDLSGKIDGTLDDYSLSLSSNLDRVVKDAVGRQVEKQTARFKQMLETRISEELEGPMEEARAKLGGLGGLGDRIENLRKESGSLLDEAKPGSMPGGLNLGF